MFLIVCCCSVKKWSVSGIVESPHNEIKCVLGIKKSKFKNFHICLRSGPRGLPPPLMVSLTIKYPLIVRGLKNAFFMSLTPLLYLYLTILWNSKSKQKGRIGDTRSWMNMTFFLCKICFRTQRIIIKDKKDTKEISQNSDPKGGGG